jgi:predicted peptidase
MTQKFVARASACLLGAACCLGLTAAAADWQDLYEAGTFAARNEVNLPYRLMRPPADPSNPDQRFPLVVFLHGAGERGNDNQAQLKHVLKEFARDDRRRDYPCFVLAPQCPQDDRWIEVDWDAPAGHGTWPEQPSAVMAALLEMVEDLSGRLPIDLDRVYLTGLSMGGYGTWYAAAHEPTRWAAAIPVCGGGDPSRVAPLAKLPLWALHGAEDSVVVPQRSREMIAAIQTLGGKPGYTEYPGVGHDSWVPAYADDQLFRWLFAQRRSEPDQVDGR